MNMTPFAIFLFDMFKEKMPESTKGIEFGLVLEFFYHKANQMMKDGNQLPYDAFADMMVECYRNNPDFSASMDKLYYDFLVDYETNEKI